MKELRVLYFRDARDLYGDGLAYATPDSAGLDLRACFAPSAETGGSESLGEKNGENAGESVTILPGERAAVPAGVAVEALEPGVAGFVYSRSGLGAVKGLTVAQGVGVIDADYRGEIVVYLLNTSGQAQTVRRGDRIAQLIFHPVTRLAPVAVDSLSDTTRGAGGFGHTGKR